MHIRRFARLSLACASAALALVAVPSALAAPLPGSAYDSGDGNQENALGLDWQGAYAEGRVRESPDANDDCFVGGVKELTPNQWAFNTSAGGCTPGKSNVRVAFANPESAAATTFAHFAFFRNDTTGNTFLTFELNQVAASWTNATGTTIPCRSDGDLLLSFEVGGSSLSTTVYRWAGDGTGPAGCRNGASGTFTGSGTVPAGRFQGAMNAAAAIANYVRPATYGASFPGNSFGEAVVDLPAVLQSMSQSPCFGFLQMQVHSRSSSSISSAMIDYTTPVPVRLQSCSVTGTQYQDTDGDGTRDAGEPGVAGYQVFADLDDDGSLDPGEPSGTSDATGFYRILGVPTGLYRIREVARPGWRCSEPSPCSYSRSIVTGGNSTGNDFGNLAPSTASGTAFEDLDGDGVREAGEPAHAGVAVYVDADDDGVRDAAEPWSTSGADGTWTIEDVPAGTYKVRETTPSGWTCSAPNPCDSVQTFSSGSSATDLAFGNYAAATLAGNVFEDVDGDGAAKVAGDGALPGAQVYLDANANDAFDIGELQALTDAAGDFSFAALAPGTYTARVTPSSASWYCTRPSLAAAACERGVTLSSGQSSTGQSFGVTRYATVSGTKFEDVDANGVKDATDGALAGFTFWVDYDNDNAQDAGEPSAISDAAGAWAIPGVRAGSWTLREVPNGAYECTKPRPCTHALVLASNATATGYQFGNHVSRSVSGFVFNDADANGAAREAGEAGLADWVVYADANNNSAKDAGEPVSTTNSLGQYSLTGLANGNYRIRLVAQAGWTCSVPAGCVATGSIGSGQSDTDVNLGVWGPSSIGGTIFEDADGDGAAREAGEAGLSGRVVYVDSDNDATRDGGEPSATSDAAGDYAIAGVNPGTYVLRQVLASGWTCSRPAPCSYSVTISSGDAGGRDFASHTTGLISGVAYEDADADATKDTGEAAVASRTIYLDADDDGVADAGEPSATTDAAGAYAFAAVAPGAYPLRQVLPAGWTQSEPAVRQTVTVASQAAVTATSLGSYAGATIAGTIFEDANFDGSAFEAGDALLSGRSVYLDLDGDGSRDGGEPATSTDTSGAYAFAGLVPGAYTVRAVTPADWACARPAACAHTVTVASGATSSGNDFGSYLGASVSGAVFEDADADGSARAAGDGGLAGRGVYLDADADATRDAAEPATLTGASGDYAFSGVVARSWTVRLEAVDAWDCDSPSGCAIDVTLTSGASHGGADFGVHTTGSVSGHLFTDRDDDGQPQVFGENDQPGRTVYADADGDGTLDAGEISATTDDHGDYVLSGLAPRAYDVRQVLPDGWSCSTPNPCSRPVTLVSGQTVTGRDFSSWTPASFSGTYFEDSAGDGDFPEPGEQGIAGRTVYVDGDADGERDGGEPSATTDAAGAYAFSALAPGTYVVRVAAQPDGWTCSYPSTCSQAFTLEAGEAAQDVDFGAWTTGTVAGVAYDDADASGAREAGEPGLAGRTVYADLDDDGSEDAGEPSTTTDATGAYELTLDPGTYRLREIAASGWGCTAPAACERTVTVGSRAALTGEDFGNRTGTGAAGGTVYEDVDGDHARDPGDDGRPAVTVYADFDANGSRDAGEPSETTDAAGAYRFAALPAGESTIRIETPSGWLCVTAPCERTVALDPDDDLGGRDFGVARPATIDGEAFEDADADGSARESGDVDVAGWGISLEDTGAADATTGADGAYAFAGLLPGSYTVRAGDRAGWTCSYPATCTWTVTLTSGEHAPAKDFGASRPASVHGHVFEDRGADGARDPDDGGREGVDVWIDDDDDATIDEGEPRAATAADGSYVIGDVRPGSWKLRVLTTGDWSCAAPAGCATTVAAASGEAVTGRDFATWTPATISGELYDDADGDGAGRESGDASLSDAVALNGGATTVQTAAGSAVTGGYELTGVRPGTYALVADLTGRTCTRPAGCARAVTLVSGEQRTGQDFGGYRPASIGGTLSSPDGPLEGRTVYLDRDGDGARGDGEPAATTDAGGAYAFTGLAPGAYAVGLDLPDGYVCSAPAGCRRTPVVASGDSSMSNDFSAYRVAGLYGAVFEDADAGGRIDAGEHGLQGATVYLDLDADDARDGGEPAATTDAGGAYAFAGLAPGAYTVRLDLSSALTCSAPAACEYARTLASGEAASALDFAVWAAGTLSGTVFNDHDGDGSRSAGEPPRAAVQVFLDRDDDGTLDAGEPAAVTAADGGYDFAQVRPGAYALRLQAPADWACTWSAACRRAADVASGQGTVIGALGVRKSTAPAAADVSSRGASGASQSQTLVVPAGGSVTLLDDAGRPTLRLAIDGQGAYVLDPATGVVTFTPVAQFTGSAQPVRYRITDADGATADGTYVATVEPQAGPAPAQAPVAVAVPARPCVSRRAMTIHWKVLRGTVLRRITITLNGRVYARLPGRSRRAVIDMRGRPPQTVKIRIAATSRKGKSYSARRSYRTCTGQLTHPPLPTLRLTPTR